MKNICFFIIFLVLITLNYYKFNETFKNNNIFNDKFDKIIYINLDHRKDRKEQILNEFKKMKIDEKKIYRLDAEHSKYNGHIGCAKSHIKALNYAKKQKFKRILVFEDDFIFTLNNNDVHDKLEKFLKDYEGNWDVVQLTSHYKTFRNSDNKDVRLINKASTSSSYMINSSFYDNLLNSLNSSVENMEKEMVEFNKKNNYILKKKKTTKYALDQHWYPLQKKSKWFLFYPYLGKQGGNASKSSIMSNNLEGFIANNVRLFSLLV